jgi:hypothetical protein
MACLLATQVNRVVLHSTGLLVRVTGRIPSLFRDAVGGSQRQYACAGSFAQPRRHTLAQLARQSLARVDHLGVQIHRLTHVILRDRLAPDQAATTRACTEAILAAGDPGDPPNPAAWPRQARLMPHVLAAGPAATKNPGLRLMAYNACWYLLACNLRRPWQLDLCRPTCTVAAHAPTCLAKHSDPGQFRYPLPNNRQLAVSDTVPVERRTVTAYFNDNSARVKSLRILLSIPHSTNSG